MPVKNKQLTVQFIVWNNVINQPAIGESANLSVRLIKDGASPIELTNDPTEIDPINAPGLYSVTLTAPENNGMMSSIAGTCSTENIGIIPQQWSNESDMTHIAGRAVTSKASENFNTFFYNGGLTTGKTVELIGTGGGASDNPKEESTIDPVAGGTVTLVSFGQTATAEIPVSGVNDQIDLVIEQVPKVDPESEFTALFPGFVYLINAYEEGTTNTYDNADINEIILTLPIDLATTNLNDLENGIITIFHSSSLAALEAGLGISVPISEIISTDYVGDGSIGSVTFRVDSLSYFNGGKPQPVAVTPIINPSGSTILKGTTISMSTTTPDSKIYMTSNGSDPTASDTEYVGPFAYPGGDATIKAVTVAIGYQNSGIASETFVHTVAATPTTNEPQGSYPKDTTIVLTSATPGATVRYTTDGSEPDAESTEYTTPIPLSIQDINLKAISIHPDYAVSDTLDIWLSWEKVDAPYTQPDSGAHPSDNSIWLGSDTSDAVLYYTTDGSPPTEASAVPDGMGYLPITTGDLLGLTLRAIGIHSNYADSDIIDFNYTIAFTDDPVLSEPSGDVFINTLIEITTKAGQTAYYTTDGSAPTIASTEYTAPFPLTGSMTVRAIAVEEFYQNSAEVSETYVAVLPTATATSNFTEKPGKNRRLSFTKNEEVDVWFTLDGTACTTAAPSLLWSPNDIGASYYDPAIHPQLRFIAKAVDHIDSAETVITLSWDKLNPPTWPIPEGPAKVGTTLLPPLSDEPLVTEFGFQYCYNESNPAGSEYLKQMDAYTQQQYLLTPRADVGGDLNNFYFHMGEILNFYYVWFNVNGAGVDPEVHGKIGAEAQINTNATVPEILTAIELALDSLGGVFEYVSTATDITITVKAPGQGAGQILHGLSDLIGFTLQKTVSGSGHQQYVRANQQYDRYDDEFVPMRGIRAFLNDRITQQSDANTSMRVIQLMEPSDQSFYEIEVERATAPTCTPSGEFTTETELVIANGDYVSPTLSYCVNRTVFGGNFEEDFGGFNPYLGPIPISNQGSLVVKCEPPKINDVQLVAPSYAVFNIRPTGQDPQIGPALFQTEMNSGNQGDYYTDSIGIYGYPNEMILDYEGLTDPKIWYEITTGADEVSTIDPNDPVVGSSSSMDLDALPITFNWSSEKFVKIKWLTSATGYANSIIRTEYYLISSGEGEGGGPCSGCV